jgi:hypothetical protein
LNITNWMAVSIPGITSVLPTLIFFKEQNVLAFHLGVLSSKKIDVILFHLFLYGLFARN